MLQQPADVIQPELAETGIAVTGEQRLAAIPQALVHVHPAAVIRKQRLGHERHGLAVLVGDVADDVLEQHHVVRRLHQLVEPLVDFGLASGGHFVMVALDVQPALDHGLHHLAAQILVMVRGRHREVAFLVARAIAQVVLPPARIPAPFLGVDEVVTLVLILIEADVVENEELGFRAEIGGVGNAAVLQVKLGLLANPARVALVALLGDRVLGVPDHHQGGGLGERIHDRGFRIGNQEHVALVDRRPTADARSIHAEALFEAAFVNLAHRVRNVMLQTRNVGEPQVELLGIVLLGKFQHFFRIHLYLLRISADRRTLDAAARKPLGEPHMTPFNFRDKPSILSNRKNR